MRKRTLVTLLLVLLLPVYAYAFELPFFGGGEKKAGEEETAKPEEKGTTSFIIHLKSGGSISTDNYTIKGNKVVIMLSSGAIYLDKQEVTSIEEVRGPEQETIQTIKVQPSGTQQQPAPAQAGQIPQVVSPESAGQTDDQGHNEQWWQDRVMNWKKKKAQAEDSYSQAEANWNQYDGQLNALGPDATQYDITRLQDLRGAARVDMDKAKQDIDEAKKMLDDVLPDEARRAGAPPGWLR